MDMLFSCENKTKGDKYLSISTISTWAKPQAKASQLSLCIQLRIPIFDRKYMEICQTSGNSIDHHDKHIIELSYKSGLIVIVQTFQIVFNLLSISVLSKTVTYTYNKVNRIFQISNSFIKCNNLGRAGCRFTQPAGLVFDACYLAGYEYNVFYEQVDEPKAANVSVNSKCEQRAVCE